MNFVQRQLLKLSGITPALGRLVESAGGVREATAEISAARSLVNDWRDTRRELAAEMEEAAAISGSGPGAAGATPLKERWWELELALEDRGWKRQMALSALEFSRYGIQQLMLISRLYFIKNPLIKRAVKISAYYTFGRGFEVSAEDGQVNDQIKAFLEDNKRELGHIAMVEKDQTLRYDGNLFFMFFVRKSDGRTLVRTVDACEIIDKVCDPDDAGLPRYFHRQWDAEVFNEATGTTETKPRECWYPAIEFEQPEAKPTTIAGVPVNWETPIYHIKVGGLPKWKFGCPETYASIDWARAYKKFLENWSAITEALARFAFTVETKGGAQAIQQFSQALSSTLGNGGTSIENNPPPTMASSFVTGTGTKLSPMRTAGATTEPEQGRRVLLMVCAADGLPETFYGDASTGSLATAKSLDRPTELQFMHRQELWREAFQTIIGYAIERGAKSPRGALKEAAAGGPAKSISSQIRVDFPAILEHDVKEMVEAIVAGVTLNGYEPAGTCDIRTAARLVLRELGVEDIETVLDAMYPEADYDAEQPDPNEEPEPIVDPAAAPPAPGRKPAAKAKTTAEEAARILLRAAAKFEERAASSGS